MQDLASVALRNTLRNERDRLELREPQTVKSRRIDRARRGKVHYDVHFGVLLHGLLGARVYGEKRLLRSPVELLDVMTAEGVDHSSHAGSFASTAVIEVEHALNGAGLETIDEGASVGIEGTISGTF